MCVFVCLTQDGEDDHEEEQQQQDIYKRGKGLEDLTQVSDWTRGWQHTAVIHALQTTFLSDLVKRKCVCIPSHGTTVSAIHQEYGSESSGHTQVRSLPDQNHYGLHKLEQQHTSLHTGQTRCQTYEMVKIQMFLKPTDRQEFVTLVSKKKVTRVPSGHCSGTILICNLYNMFGMLQFLCRYVFTFTMVLLCLMNVWKPSQRSFMQSSNATITRANNSRVAWTYRDRTHPLVFHP